MIPKKIHYIWLGNKPLDKVSWQCIESWRKILPDYEIICWSDEECLEMIEKNAYAKEAYERRKYAFVSDYLRLYILFSRGGVYMDTDVKVLKKLDRFLRHGAFTCFENKEMIMRTLILSKKTENVILRRV